MIKKLQNNFTTPEQSKRLLKLGVPADSADLYYWDGINIYSHHVPIIRRKGDASLMLDTHTPCWSVGRLIEIYLICTPDIYDLFYPIISPLGRKFPGMEGYRKLLQEDRIIDTFIEELEERKQKDTIDFSKLEELEE